METPPPLVGLWLEIKLYPWQWVLKPHVSCMQIIDGRVTCINSMISLLFALADLALREVMIISVCSILISCGEIRAQLLGNGMSLSRPILDLGSEVLGSGVGVREGGGRGGDGASLKYG